MSKNQSNNVPEKPNSTVKSNMGVDGFMLLVDKNKAVIVGLLLSSSAISVTNAQMSHMAPNDPCIATQIQMYGNIAPGDTVGFVISGDSYAGLSIVDDNQIRLRKMVNGVYTGGPIAVDVPVGDTLVIIGTGGNGESQTITYYDEDCDPWSGELNVVLPVTWLDNGAEKNQDGTATIRWTVAQEVNNEKFVVERTTDQVNWKAIEEVEGRGNANDQMTYSVTDESPRYGVNHYRVKQVDFDGNSSYSPIKSVKINEVSSKISIFPNPTADFVEVEGDAIESIVVYNELGHQMNVKVDGNRVDLSQLPNGLFVIETIQEGNNVQMHRIVKSSK